MGGAKEAMNIPIRSAMTSAQIVMPVSQSSMHKQANMKVTAILSSISRLAGLDTYKHIPKIQA
jgi:hypothetical protein